MVDLLRSKSFAWSTSANQPMSILDFV